MSALSYEGPEKYIFVSYAHRDSDKVTRVLEKLVEAGYRIWYDDGIAPGSEWPENIAQHLDGCAVFMAFISNNSIESANCRREVTFALSREKPFLGILLEPTEMSLGMQMQLSAHQCILRHNYRWESDFIEKIFSSPDIACCKIQPEPEPEPETIRISTCDEPEQVFILEEPLPVAAEKPAKIKPEKLKGEKPPRAPKRPLTTGQKLLLGIPAGLVALAAVLALLFFVILPVRVTPDKKVGPNETFLSFYEETITADTVKKINKLKKLQTLAFRQCTIEEGALEGLSLPEMTTFTVEHSQVGSFGFLEHSPKLVTLRLVNCGVTDDNISLADDRKLAYLTLSENPGFTDLSRLNLAALRELDVSGTGVTDVSCLADAERLSAIRAANNAITDIECLAPLEGLHLLDFSGCGITRVTTPFMSLSMKEVYMGGNGLEDLSGFANFAVLQIASVNDNRLSDIAWLAKSVKTLRYADLSENPLAHTQVEFLKDGTELTYLGLSGIALENLDLVTGLTKLQTLAASRCGLKAIPDMTALADMKNLYLDHNRLTGLSGMPPMGQNNYTMLDLSGNQLGDISQLPAGNYTFLVLLDNPIIYGQGVFDALEGTHLFVDYHESLQTCGQSKNYMQTFVRDCPADRQVMLQESLGGWVVYVDTAQAREILAMDGVEFQTVAGS